MGYSETGRITEIAEYQKLAQRTAPTHLNKEKRLVVATMGLAGEAGETVDMIKKHIGHGHKLDLLEVMKELGDLQWYINEVASIFNIPLEDILTMNIDKLSSRYPEGFSEERSINRAE